MDSGIQALSQQELDQRYKALYNDSAELQASCYAASGSYELASKKVLETINATRGKCPPYYWYLLFDLLEITEQQARHEKTADVFAKLFALSAPQYRGYERTNSSFSGRNSLLMDGWIGQLREEKEKDFLTNSQQAQQAKIDVSKAQLGSDQDMISTACSIIERVLHRLRTNKVPTLLLGGDSLLQRLEEAIKGPNLPKDVEHARSWWYSLLELYQWQRTEVDFEEKALEFADQFGLSPPSYEAAVEFTPEHAQKPAAEDDKVIIPETEIISFSSLKKQLQTRMPPWQLDCRMTKRWTVEAATEARDFLLRQAREKLTLIEPNHILVGVAKAVGLVETLIIIPRKR